MTTLQEQRLTAMRLPAKEEVAVRAIVDLLERELGTDDDMKVRVLATVNHYAQAEGFFDSIIEVPRPRYRLRAMKIGDEVWFKTKAVGNVRTSCANFAARNKEYKFAVTSEPGGCSVRRISANEDLRHGAEPLPPRNG